MRIHLVLTSLAVLASAMAVDAAPESIRLISPSSYLPGVPVTVRAELRHSDGSLARDLWDAEIALTASPVGATVTPNKIRLFNGIGSALVTIAGPAPITLVASFDALEATRTLTSLAGQPVASFSGSVPGPVTEWSGIVHVTGNVTVPAGVTLRLLPGTLVLVDGVLTGEGQAGECQNAAATPTKCGKVITVQGKLESMGLEDDPVVITAFDRTKAWGEIHHNNAATSFYDFTIISRGGNSPRGGHTNTGPTVRTNNSTVRFDGCVLGDTAGKSMQCADSDLTFIDTLLTRSIMGPEIDGTALLFDHSYSLELHGSDDNDGIYLHSQKAGQRIALVGGVIAFGDDDGIDTLGSKVTIDDFIVRDFANPNEDSKGVSVFSGDVTLKGCLLAANKVGLTAKSQNGGSATVHMERCTVIDSTQIGIQAQDKFGEPDLRIRFFVTSSIIRSPDAVQTDYAKFPGDIQIKFSDLSEAWTGAGNISSDPTFSAPLSHDYHLADSSPCIDSGEAGLAPDPDGSRADMGVYPYSGVPGEPRFVRGRVNSDPSVDISDAVAGLLYLFAGATIGCPAAADVNDDGTVNVTDSVFLLEFLFRGGSAPPAPSASCGLDSTDDGLECPSPTCG